MDNNDHETGDGPRPELPADPEGTASDLTRRELFTLAAVTGGALIADSLIAAPTEAAPAQGPDARPTRLDLELRVNGKEYRLTLDPRTTLLDALREHLHLTGTKKGCDHGQCGACTVVVGERRINSCLTLAVMHEGDRITTIEGLGTAANLHPMQAAFVKHDGYQCGYCTSGQIMSAVALLKEPCGPDDAAVKELMSGNICRCGAYGNIVAAIQDVRKKA
jgi:xanthine dehydrogenase YagT iron-sulfur-binding subunit